MLAISYLALLLFHIDPSIVESPSSASILQGWNHTFWCKGNGSFIEWEINGLPTYKLTEDSKLMVVDLDFPVIDGCARETAITVHAKSAPEDNTLFTFIIRCVIKKDPLTAEFSEALLNVHGKFICTMSIRVYSMS